jgi:hypothetical protein
MFRSLRNSTAPCVACWKRSRLWRTVALCLGLATTTEAAWFDPSRNRVAHLLDPLATGAVLYQRGDFKKLAGGPREETLWLLGEAGIGEFENLPEAPCSRDSVAFPTTGLYVMAGSDPQRQFVSMRVRKVPTLPATATPTLSVSPPVSLGKKCSSIQESLSM